MLVTKKMRDFVVKEFWNELYQWIQEWKYNKSLPIKKVLKKPNKWTKSKNIIIHLKNNKHYEIRIYCRVGKWYSKPTDFDIEINLADTKEMYQKQKYFQKYLDQQKNELFDFLKNKTGD